MIEGLADCHLVAERGSPDTLCGLHNAWPRVWVEVVTEFLDKGWHMLICAECLAVIGRVPTTEGSGFVPCEWCAKLIPRKQWGPPPKYCTAWHGVKARRRNRPLDYDMVGDQMIYRPSRSAEGVPHEDEGEEG